MTEKQKRFAQEYVIDLNATQACIRAGYAKKHARQIGSELMTKPDVRQLVQNLQDEIAYRNQIKADDVVQELSKLAFWDIKNFVNESNEVVDLSKIDKELAKPIVGIKVKVVHISKDIKEVTTELKLADKRASLVDLGRHLGIFKEDNKQKNATVSPMTDEQFNSILNIAREAKADQSK